MFSSVGYHEKLHGNRLEPCPEFGYSAHGFRTAADGELPEMGMILFVIMTKFHRLLLTDCQAHPFGISGMICHFREPAAQAKSGKNVQDSLQSFDALALFWTGDLYMSLIDIIL